MTTQTGAMPATHFRRGWIYVLTLSLVTINYMDRSALGVVAQAIRGEFKLSPIEMGYLFSSFFWSYALCLLPIGIMLDRYSTRLINSVGIAVWSLAMAATAGVWSFASSDRRAPGHGRGRGDLDPVLRPHRARMDAGPGARRRHRVLERRQFRRSGHRRHRRRRADQRLGLACRLHRSRRAGLGLARLQPDLVRPAGEGELAHRGRAQQDFERAFRRLARRDRHARQSRRDLGTA